MQLYVRSKRQQGHGETCMSSIWRRRSGLWTISKDGHTSPSAGLVYLATEMHIIYSMSCMDDRQGVFSLLRKLIYDVVVIVHKVPKYGVLPIFRYFQRVEEFATRGMVQKLRRSCYVAHILERIQLLLEKKDSANPDRQSVRSLIDFVVGSSTIWL
jgi:ERCC4-related helicase